GAWFALPARLAVRVDPPSLALGLAVAGLAAALLATFRPTEPVPLARGLLKSFGAGTRDALARRRARHALVGLWAWTFVFLAAVTALIRFVPPAGRSDEFGIDRVTRGFALAVVAGFLGSALNRHPYRHAGFAFVGALVAAGSLACWRFSGTGF